MGYAVADSGILSNNSPFLGGNPAAVNQVSDLAAKFIKVRLLVFCIVVACEPPLLKITATRGKFRRNSPFHRGTKAFFHPLGEPCL